LNYRPVIVLAAHDKSFVLSVATLLDRLGFDVIPIENNEKALSLAKRFIPSMVLLDEDLPDSGGLFTLQQLKEDSYTFFIPVVMMTASSNREMIANCKRMECTAYINKPIHLLDFNRTIYKCLNADGGPKRRHLRALYERDVTVTCEHVTRKYHAVTLSEGGLFLRDTQLLSPGKKVALRLHLNGQTCIEIRGSVIYNKKMYGGVFNTGPGMGIAFEEMENNNAVLIKEYLINKLTYGPHVNQYITH
jgi:CheY-like chemotaxis protein